MAATPSHPLSSLVILLNRTALGAYFLLAGWGKLREEFRSGLGSFYRSTFSKAQPDWLPAFVAAPYGYALPWLEVLAGALLILGFFGRLSALVVAAMLASFIAALGIGGDPPRPFSPNLIFLSLALMLALIGPGGFSIDRLRRQRPVRSKPAS